MIVPIGNPSVDILFRAVQSRNAFEETVTRLEQAIVLGFVRPGERLPPERRLVELLGVSRSTLREAIRVLHHAGYVSSARGRTGGTTVLARPNEVSEKSVRSIVRANGAEILDLLDRRRVIESGLAGLAAERCKSRELAPLRALLEETARDRSQFSRLHAQFHLGIAQLARAPKLHEELTAVHFRLNHVIPTVRMAQFALRGTGLSHDKLVDALAAGNGERARTLMEKHILVTDRFIRSYLKS